MHIFCIFSAYLVCWSLCNGLFYAYFMLILCIFWACCANDLHMSCMCLHILNIYSSYLACWSLLSLGIFNACFVHITAYLRQIPLYFLIFSHIFCISYDIYTYLLHFWHTNAYLCLFQFCRSPARASSRPFWFHSGSTSQQQLHIIYDITTLLPKHTRQQGSGKPRASPCPGRGGAGRCTKYVVY